MRPEEAHKHLAIFNYICLASLVKIIPLCIPSKCINMCLTLFTDMEVLLLWSGGGQLTLNLNQSSAAGRAQSTTIIFIRSSL